MDTSHVISQQTLPVSRLTHFLLALELTADRIHMHCVNNINPQGDASPISLVPKLRNRCVHISTSVYPSSRVANAMQFTQYYRFQVCTAVRM